MSATAFQRMRREKAEREQPKEVVVVIMGIEEAHYLAFKEEKSRELEKLTVKELKQLLDEKGIKYDPKTKKEDLIKLLEGAE